MRSRSRRAQRRPRLLLCILLLLFAVPVWAQGPVYPYVEFVGHCEGSAIKLTLRGEDDGDHAEIVGIDIYRRVHGACGGELTRITENPIPRPTRQEFTLESTDPQVAEGVLYQYVAFGVDMQRTTRTTLYTLYWLPGSNDATFVGCGRTLAGHGTLTDEGWIWHLESRPGSCFPSAFVERYLPELAPYVGTDVAVRIYGGFAWSVEGHLMVPESFEPSPCATAVEPATWGSLKRLYR